MSLVVENEIEAVGFSPQARIEPWPTEAPLTFLVTMASLFCWLVLVFSIIGLVYIPIIALVVFATQVGFVSYIRGNAVKLGPGQLPELHAAVTRVAHQLGMKQVPEAYLMQAGGSLNAFATRFLGDDIVVLFADLLEACEDNDAARDMIIAHELGHVHRGHLKFHWFLLPGLMIPFLGSALSQAREYTCDRYGLRGSGGLDGALLGLSVLAAGGKFAKDVNVHALSAQRADLNTGFMTLGRWLSSHPPLAARVAALDPSLDSPIPSPNRGAVRIALGIALIGGLAVALSIVIASQLTSILEEFSSVLGSDSSALPDLVLDESEVSAMIEHDAQRIHDASALS